MALTGHLIARDDKTSGGRGSSEEEEEGEGEEGPVTGGSSVQHIFDKHQLVTEMRKCAY